MTFKGYSEIKGFFSKNLCLILKFKNFLTYPRARKNTDCDRIGEIYITVGSTEVCHSRYQHLNVFPCFHTITCSDHKIVFEEILIVDYSWYFLEIKQSFSNELNTTCKILCFAESRVHERCLPRSWFTCWITVLFFNLIENLRVIGNETSKCSLYDRLIASIGHILYKFIISFLENIFFCCRYKSFLPPALKYFRKMSLNFKFSWNRRATHGQY